MDPLGSRVLDAVRCPHDYIVDNYSVESADFWHARDPLPISRHKETLAATPASARVRTRPRSRGPRVLPGIPAGLLPAAARTKAGALYGAAVQVPP